MTRDEAIKLISIDGKVEWGQEALIDDLIKLGVLKVEKAPDHIKVALTRMDGACAIISIEAICQALTAAGFDVTVTPRPSGVTNDS